MSKKLYLILIAPPYILGVFLFFSMLSAGGGTGGAKLMLILFGVGIVALIWTGFISAIRYFSKPRKEVAKEELKEVLNPPHGIKYIGHINQWQAMVKWDIDITGVQMGKHCGLFDTCSEAVHARNNFIESKGIKVKESLLADCSGQ